MAETPEPEPTGEPAARGARTAARRIAELARGPLLLGFAIAAAVPFLRYVSKTYALADWLAWPLLAVLGYALLFWTAAASLGLVVLRRVLRHEEASSLEALALALPLGLLGFDVVMYGAGALALYRPWFAVALALAMVASGARELVSLAKRFAVRPDPAPPSPIGRVVTGAATAFGVVGVVFLYLQAMTPDSINFDASWSHLSIAQDYAREGRMVAFDADYTRCFPHLASIAHVYAFLVPLPNEPLRWMLALHDEVGAVLGTLLGVGALVEELVGRRVRGGWAAFFLFPGIFVYDLNVGGGADHYQALFTAPLVLAALRAFGTTDTRRYVLTGLLASGALATKLHAVHLVTPLGVLLVVGWGRALVVAWRASRDARKCLSAIAGPIVGFGVATVAGLAPHFVRNLVFHGNPVYPFALDVFRGSHPTVPRAAFLFEYLFKDWTWRPHGTPYENVRDAVKLFFTFSFSPHYSFTREVPSYGSLFTLTLPWLLVVRGRKPIAIATLLGFGAIFVWAMTFRVDRHLVPFAPLLAASTCALLVRAWELGVFARVGVSVLVGAQLAFAGDVLSYSGYSRITASLDLMRTGYEGRAKSRFDGYRRAFRDIGAALPKDALVIEHTYRPNLGINRRIYMDWAGQQGLISYEAVRNPREMFDLWAKLGVTHVIHMPNERQSPTKQEDAIFTTLLHRWGKSPRHFGGYELVTLPKTPPPADHPWRALSLGLPGYQDGVYPIEAMNTPEALPPPVRSYAAPTTPLDRSADAVERAMDGVDVVFVGPGHADPATQRVVGARFELVASYARAYSIFVKKSP